MPQANLKFNRLSFFEQVKINTLELTGVEEKVFRHVLYLNETKTTLSYDSPNSAILHIVSL